MLIDSDRVEREFRRAILAEEGGDPLTMAAAPDFDEEPVPAQTFIRDKAYLGLPPLSDIQMGAVLHAERILYEPTFDALGWPRYRVVNEIELAWGKGSGKDYISRILLSRWAYLLLCLASPQAYFGMPGSESIHMTNLAQSAPQARNIFFEPWVEMLRRSRWFRDQMDLGATDIHFDKQVLAVSGHSAFETQEGQNLIGAVIDEISGFKTAVELSARLKLQEREPAQSAQGIYRTARSSIVSRFPKTGKLVAISFTRFKNDPIDELEKRAQRDYERRGEESRMYGSRAATWEVNPLRSREDFDEAYETDARDAQCRYECRPSASPNRYFQNLLAVRKALGIPLQLDSDEIEKLPAAKRVGIEYIYGPDQDNPESIPGWQVRFDLSKLERHSKICAIHFDLGITQDLAGMAMSHVEGWRPVTHTLTDEKTGIKTDKVVNRPIIKTDFVIAFEQQLGDLSSGQEGSDIQIRWLRQLIYILIAEGWKIRLVSGDGYQSTDMFQQLESRGIDTELYSLDRKTEGYDILKNSIYSGDVTAPFSPLLFAEIESLVKITDKKIDHQAGSSKDMADAWAGSVRGALKLLETHGGGPSTEVWAGGRIDMIQELATAAGEGQGYSDPEDEFFVGGGVSWRR